jgi:hypothetical protein
VGNGSLQPNTTYRWKVVCACQLNPLQTTPWSSVTTFTTGSSNLVENFGSEDQIFGSHFNLFPNPANEEVNLYASFEVANVAIYDVTGRMVRQEQFGETKNAVLSLNGLAKGTYLIEASNATEKVTRRLTVE